MDCTSLLTVAWDLRHWLVVARDSIEQAHPRNPVLAVFGIGIYLTIIFLAFVLRRSPSAPRFITNAKIRPMMLILSFARWV